LQSFILGIERDKAAVKAGLTLPTSNGLVEGKVNKLKLIKRMGYGRAGFPLLRQRVSNGGHPGESQYAGRFVGDGSVWVPHSSQYSTQCVTELWTDYLASTECHYRTL